MRNSSWRITLDPFGSPRVLVDFGDLLEREIELDASQLTTTGTFDFAVSAKPAARGNRRRRLGIERRIAHDSDAAAWHEAAKQLAAGPWGGSAIIIQVHPITGSPELFRGALLSSAHGPMSDFGIAESLHEWSIRCARLVYTEGDGITVLGGWYNAPGGGGGITVIIPGGSGITPGTIVKVVGVPGIPSGYYPVTGVVIGGGNGGGITGDAVTIGAPHEEPERLGLAEVSGLSTNGDVTVNYPGSVLKIEGMDDGAAYTAEYPGSLGVQAVVPDVWGRAEIALGTITSRIDYAWWYAGGWSGTSINPLPIDGQNHAPGAHPTTGTVNEQGPTGWSVKLYRNGVLVDEMSIMPAWSTSKTFDVSGPASHTLDAGAAVVFGLSPSGNWRPSPGIPVQIDGGTITPVTLDP